MSGTGPEDDLAERADHEAGHYVAARALKMNCRPHWVTVEEREESGGRCSLIAHGPIPLSHQVQFLLAGITTESVGKLIRRYGTNIPREDVLKVESEQVVMRAITEGGHGDVLAVLNLIKEASADERCNPVEEFGKVKALMFSQPWRNEWLWLSLHLRRDKTLYGGEANLIFEISTNDVLKRFYHSYKQYRRRASPPKGWFDGASPRYPAGPWYEDISTFLARAGQRDGETEEQRDARLAIDMES